MTHSPARFTHTTRALLVRAPWLAASVSALLSACGAPAGQSAGAADSQGTDAQLGDAPPESGELLDSFEYDAGAEGSSDAPVTDTGTLGGADIAGNDASSPIDAESPDAPTPGGDDTPSVPDAAEPLALAINEIAWSPVSGADWFEVVALGPEPVNLSQFTVQDDDPDHAPAPLPDLILAPGAWAIIWAADTAPEDGSAWVPFKLGSSDSLTLRLGELIVDAVAWNAGDAPAPTTWGRLPDGVGDFAQTTPTPGSANAAWAGGAPLDTPFPDEVLTVKVDLTAADWQAILATPLAEEEFPATLTYGSIVLHDVGFRTKGNSSLNSVAKSSSQRYSFKLDTNEYVAGQKLLGVEQIALDNGFKDPTFMREHLAYELARERGLVAPRTSFVDLWVNGEHLGLYTAVEVVEDEMLEDHFGESNGALYKPEFGWGNLAYAGPSASSYPDLESESDDTTDHSAFIALLAALKSGDPATIEAALDVDTALRYLAWSTALVNLDSYQGTGHNYYLYERDGRFTIIPWDTNEAFGVFTCGCSATKLIALPIDEPTCGALSTKPLIASLLAVSEWREQYRSYLAELAENAFDPTSFAVRVQAIADHIRPWVEADPTKFFTAAQFEQALTADLSAAAGSSFGLTSFAAKRRQALLDQLAGTTATSNDGQGGCPSAGGGGGGGPNPAKCPDGVCDAAEQANPTLCPADCP